MAWRLHLTNQAIHRLDILPGKPTLLAIWTRRDKIAYYEIETGLPAGEQVISTVTTSERQSDEWQDFVGSLITPHQQYLPQVRTPYAAIYTTDDGRMRLYHTGDTDLFLETEGKEVKLHTAEAKPFVAIDFDPLLGITVALDERGKLHLYQQNIRVGHFDLALPPKPELPQMAAIARGGGPVFASNGERIVLSSISGKSKLEIDTHYFVHKMALSPNGRLLATSDLETGVIRVYNGSDLAPLYQRFAIDLLAESTQMQLLADLPPLKVGLSALALTDKGTLAFAMSGVVCVTDTTFMDELPRPQRLL